MKAIPWQKTTANAAFVDQFRNIDSGISGYFASFFSLITNTRTITTPNMIKQMTVGLDQGNVAPPNSRPSSNMSTTPIIDNVPNQSMALRPSRKRVRGLWTSRNRKSRMKVVPEMGRLIQKHLHEISILSIGEAL